jgi:hypothetical protein
LWAHPLCPCRNERNQWSIRVVRTRQWKSLQNVSEPCNVEGNRGVVPDRDGHGWGRRCGIIVMPSALAVFKLTTRSNFVGCSIGRSPGLVPFNILSTETAARRYSCFGMRWMIHRAPFGSGLASAPMTPLGLHPRERKNCSDTRVCGRPVGRQIDPYPPNIDTCSQQSRARATGDTVTFGEKVRFNFLFASGYGNRIPTTR